MATLTYALEAWANIMEEEIKELERKQGKTVKRIFQQGQL